MMMAILLTSGDSSGILSTGITPLLFRGGSIARNCSTPPTRTPQARAVIGTARFGATKRAAEIIATFRSAGAAAGARKCR